MLSPRNTMTSRPGSSGAGPDGRLAHHETPAAISASAPIRIGPRRTDQPREARGGGRRGGGTGSILPATPRRPQAPRPPRYTARVVPDPRPRTYLLLVTVVAIWRSYPTYYRGIQSTGPSVTAVVMDFQPLAGVLLATQLLGKRLSVAQGLG